MSQQQQAPPTADGMKPEELVPITGNDTSEAQPSSGGERPAEANPPPNLYPVYPHQKVDPNRDEPFAPEEASTIFTQHPDILGLKPDERDLSENSDTQSTNYWEDAFYGTNGSGVPRLAQRHGSPLGDDSYFAGVPRAHSTAARTDRPEESTPEAKPKDPTFPRCQLAYGPGTRLEGADVSDFLAVMEGTLVISIEDPHFGGYLEERRRRQLPLRHLSGVVSLKWLLKHYSASLPCELSRHFRTLLANARMECIPINDPTFASSLEDVMMVDLTNQTRYFVSRDKKHRCGGLRNFLSSFI